MCADDAKYMKLQMESNGIPAFNGKTRMHRMCVSRISPARQLVARRWAIASRRAARQCVPRTRPVGGGPCGRDAWLGVGGCGGCGVVWVWLVVCVSLRAVVIVCEREIVRA